MSLLSQLAVPDKRCVPALPPHPPRPAARALAGHAAVAARLSRGRSDASRCSEILQLPSRCSASPLARDWLWRLRTSRRALARSSESVRSPSEGFLFMMSCGAGETAVAFFYARISRISPYERPFSKNSEQMKASSPGILEFWKCGHSYETLACF